MVIKGLQKLTLLDYPGHMAATVFLGGCQFRCPFCHNASLVLAPDELPDVDEDEFFAFLSKRRGILDGVAVTGGEPLLARDIDRFFERIKDLGFAVKLDTNGALPAALRRVVEAGLVDYVAMDIKNSQQRYAETVGLPKAPLDAIRESAAFLLEGGVPYEFRTTVVRELHTPADMEAIGRWIAGAERYYLQVFRDSGEILASFAPPADGADPADGP
ncbi:MAG: anaerobic ribonucleoside-triphosphate reductase activating protein, partial [Clostridia bacterium]|nr:anaerobic ribonucleoside-triphosphate reductase activating protein [Clostridia bacterium]